MSIRLSELLIFLGLMVILVATNYAATTIFTNIGLVYLYQGLVILSSVYSVMLFIFLFMDIGANLTKSAKTRPL